MGEMMCGNLTMKTLDGKEIQIENNEMLLYTQKNGWQLKKKKTDNTKC